jgi:cell division protease FtsH
VARDDHRIRAAVAERARRFHQLGWRRRFTVYAACVGALMIANLWIANRATAIHRPRVPYSPFFLDQVRSGNVAAIISTGTAVQGRLRHSAVDPAAGDRRVKFFKTEIPAFADETALSRLLQQRGVTINAEPLQGGIVWWKGLLFGFGPTIVFLLLLFWIIRRMGRSQSMLGGFGRSKARRYRGETGTINFADVAGIDEAKAELTEIVDFLRFPDRYERLGGRIPKGVLLSGAPGTGKTLLARAVAGEAHAPFFSLSASEFVEAIVGVGASRVRDLFRQAKDASPAIVFIDEIDAIGRTRSATGGNAGSDEREQTLNQILTEMDGFDPSTTVVVIAATNRVDVLDKALLRPGRFDRRVVVLPPDQIGRERIIEVHTEGVPLAGDVDLASLARLTSGMVGADLANLVNEAALLAARRSHTQVESADFESAMEKLLLGVERKVIQTTDDRRRTAYHEAGHALVGMLTPGADPVRKVSIVPRGISLGVTVSRPDADRFNYTKSELQALSKVLLGGRAAEEIAFDEVTTGVEADLRELTRLTRRMVGRWGMSESVGLIAAVGYDDEPLLAPETVALVDAEVRRIIDVAYREVLELLDRERARLDALAEVLMEVETLDENAAYAASGLSRHLDAPVRPALG